MRSRSLRPPFAAALVTSILLAACTPTGAPSPAPADMTDVDTRAARLSGVVRAGGADATAAFGEALAAAGIGVRALDGQVLRAAQQPSLGLAFAEHDPAVILRAQQQGGTVTLAELADTLRVLAPNADQGEIARLLREDLRRDLSSDVPTVRFWARFVTSLTPDGQPALTSDAAPADVPVSAAQHALILLRLAGGAAARARTLDPTVPLTSASSSSGGTMRALAAPANCTFGGTEGTIMDAAALGLTSGFGQLLGYLDGISSTPGESAASRASDLLGLANLVTSYAKFVLTFAGFQMDLTVDQPDVTRTKSTVSNGDGVHTATVKVHYDLSAGLQYLNCFRLAFNHVGVDFSTPNAGVVEGADVRWRVFAADGDGSYAQKHTNILAALAGEEVMHDRTGADGTAQLRFEGVRQDRDLGPAPTPVDKSGEVTAISTIKSASFAADLVDALGTAAGGVGGLLTMPQELAYRMWPISSTMPLRVRDWKPSCEGVTGNTCWLGTITVTQAMSESKTLLDPNDAPAGTDEYREQLRGEYVVTGVEDAGAIVTNLKVQGRLGASHERKLRYDATYDVTCADGETVKTETHRYGITDKGSATRDLQDNVYVNLHENGSYEINNGSWNTSTRLRGTGEYSDYNHYRGACNPFQDNDRESSKATTPTYDLDDFTEQGVAQEQDGVLTIQGSRTFTNDVEPPTTYTVTWNLTRVTVE
ncbi:hypothetical protein [Deinococcus pimensis]|uniref:hypothetical protein n=1 Tax=Deinococcus pimensis TaxID=309888 RepID=UPI0004898880|nr:hypothetical protein [Deinococcus pimensis]